MTVHSPSQSDTDPTFADAVFLDVRLLDAIKTDTDISLKDFFVVVRAFWIDAEPVWEFIRHVYCDYQTAQNLSRANISFSATVSPESALPQLAPSPLPPL